MASTTVAVIDYGMGNLHSVASALGHVAPDAEVWVTADPERVRTAERVIFPGVGAIRDCMAEIRRLGFDALLHEQVASGKPVLGICVGMQALLEHSEENGGVDCLGLLPGEVRFFGAPKGPQGEVLKVPHMGWNQVHHSDHPLWQGIAQDTRFYFVHSYYVQSGDPTLVAGECQYGVPFSAALAKANLFAVQFHPEKSHEAGLRLLQNFMAWDGRP
ncbi:imidazole glycerol phosphate synthase subunit HisH [Marinimicrobium alkaliphilum]|uniref:imidazole glycerol phosphate synthase subunit HisH n=1 Tax=Marinimicrobium alkaliphilum TaxID=2202654 RepID=UPI000DBAA178|nr:imidazole glycerol phosphate synthase subunit HisH [Marinimicrobium alkaliphilum]